MSDDKSKCFCGQVSATDRSAIGVLGWYQAPPTPPPPLHLPLISLGGHLIHAKHRNLHPPSGGLGQRLSVSSHCASHIERCSGGSGSPQTTSPRRWCWFGAGDAAIDVTSDSALLTQFCAVWPLSPVSNRWAESGRRQRGHLCSLRGARLTSLSLRFNTSL